MSLRLDGTNPLSHIGVTPESLAADYVFKRNPTTRDYQGFNLMTRWLNYVDQTVWVLVSKISNVATWIQITGVIRTLTSNSGGAVGPDGSGNINVIGDGVTITGVGNPATNTITLSAVATGTVETLTGNSGGAVSPIAGNINVVGTGVISVVGNPGTHTLTVTPSGAVASSFPTDSGTATPALGVLNVLGGTAGRDINTSGSGNTIHVDLKNAITLGDLSAIPQGSNALTLTTGDIILNSASGVATAEGIAKIKFFPAQVGQQTCDVYFYLNNVFIGQSTGNQTMTPSVALFNVGIGSNTFMSNVTGTQNVAIGNGALQLATDSDNSIAIGFEALNAITGTHDDNIGIGSQALLLLASGDRNTSVGDDSTSAIVSGNDNTSLGFDAGSNLTTNDSSNICIGSNTAGTAGNNNTLRIGAGAGTGAGQLNRAFIHGIRGITTGVNDAIAVLVDSAGQLGTVSSSLRYKKDVQDLNDFSSPVMNLRPVSFKWKENDSFDWGLIAEEVAQTMPEMAVYDEDGNPETVKYHALCVLLLNELKKQDKRIKALEGRLC